MRRTRLARSFARLIVLVGLSAPLAAYDAAASDSLTPDAFMSGLSRHKATLLFFFVDDCPVARRDVSVVNALRRSARPDTLEIVGVQVEAGRPAPANLFDAGVRVVSDPEHALVAMVGARTTPEYFLFDEAGRLRYRGAIDDYALGLTRHRPKARRRYLADAVSAVLAGRPVVPVQTPAPGCVIEPLRKR